MEAVGGIIYLRAVFPVLPCGKSRQHAANGGVAVDDFISCGSEQLLQLPVRFQVAPIQRRALEGNVINPVRILQLQSVLFIQVISGGHVDFPAVLLQKPHKRFMKLSYMALDRCHQQYLLHRNLTNSPE